MPTPSDEQDFDRLQRSISKASARDTGTPEPADMTSVKAVDRQQETAYPPRPRRDHTKVTVFHPAVGKFVFDAVEVAEDADNNGTLGILYDHTQGVKFSPMFDQVYDITWDDHIVVSVRFLGAALRFQSRPHTLLVFLDVGKEKGDAAA